MHYVFIDLYSWLITSRQDTNMTREHKFPPLKRESHEYLGREHAWVAKEVQNLCYS